MVVRVKRFALRRGVNRRTGEISFFRVFPADSVGAFAFCQLHNLTFEPGCEMVVPYCGVIYHGRPWCDPDRCVQDCEYNPELYACPEFCAELVM